MSRVTTDLYFKRNLDALTNIDKLNGPLAYADSLAHTFHVQCYDGPDESALTAVTAIGYFVRADKNTVVITGSVSGNEAVVTLPAEAYAVPGPFRFLIRLVEQDGTKRVCFWAEGNVLETLTGEMVNPGDPMPDISDLLAAIDRMNQAADAVAEAVEEEGTFNTRLLTAENEIKNGKDFDLLHSEAIPGTYSVVENLMPVDDIYAVFIEDAELGIEINMVCTDAYKITHKKLSGDAVVRIDEVDINDEKVVETRNLRHQYGDTDRVMYMITDLTSEDYKTEVYEK